MYIELEEIINNLMVEEGKTSENDFLRYFKLGMNGMKELSIDVGGGVKTVELIVDANTLTVDLPNDYIKYTKIGVYASLRAVISLVPIASGELLDYSDENDGFDGVGKEKYLSGQLFVGYRF